VKWIIAFVEKLSLPFQIGHGHRMDTSHPVDWEEDFHVGRCHPHQKVGLIIKKTEMSMPGTENECNSPFNNG